MPSDPIAIQAQLNDLSSGLAEKVGRDVGRYTVALLAVLGHAENERLHFHGSGTLVRARDQAYILTAYHVWEKIKDAVGIGLTLNEEDVDHRFFIDVKLVAAFGPQKLPEWDNARGPDMVLLRIPPQYLGKLEEVKKFYSLTADVPELPKVNSLDVWILIGSPGEQGTMLPKHASLTINAIYAAIRSESTHEDLDYFDLDMDTTFPGIPKKFNGMSGGGFWIVSLFEASEGGVQWEAHLVGMASWQLFPAPTGTAKVRCLGEKSIRSLISYLQQAES